MSTPAPGRTRARDLDRANAAGLLDAAYAEGQLGADEYHERTAQAAAARTLDELARLTADLQAPAAARDLAGSGPSVGRKTLRRAGSGGSYPDHTRARTADRLTTVELLDNARAEGQLSEEEHETLGALASEARTLGDLADLVADLQRPADASPQPRPPRSHRRQRYLVAVAVAAVLAACAGYLAVARETDETSPAARTGPALDLSAVSPRVIATPSLVTGEGLATFLRNYQAEFGDLQVDVLRLFADFGTIERAVPGQPNRSIKYDYRGGFAQSSDVTTRKPDTPSVDLSVLNVRVIGKALADAPATTRVPNGVLSHIEVSVNDVAYFGEYGIGKGQPVVEVYVTNSFNESGRFLLTPAGEIRHIWAFEG